MVSYRYDYQKYLSDPVSMEQPKIPDYVGLAIMLIASKLGKKFNFGGYSFNDEMQADAVENCLRYINNFNPEKSNNPFAYFTQIIKFAFIRRILKERKQQYIKYKNLQNMFTTEDLVEHGAISRHGTFHDTITDFVKKYEDAIETKKNEKIKKNLEIFIEE